MYEITNKKQLIELSNICHSRTKIINELIIYKQEKNNCINIINKKINKKIYCFGPGWCYTWRIVSMVLIILGIAYQANICYTSKDFNSVITSSFLIFIFVLAFIGLAILTLYKSLSSLSHYSDVSRAQSKIQILDENINKNINQIKFLSKQIETYDWLPEMYWYAGDIIIGYIINRRADNLKEAINLFEYELRCDVQFNQHMQALQQINNELRRIRR